MYNIKILVPLLSLCVFSVILHTKAQEILSVSSNLYLLLIHIYTGGQIWHCYR